MSTELSKNNELHTNKSMLEILSDKIDAPLNPLDVLKVPIMEDKNPYTSGFDDKHPMPTYKQLRNTGFSDHLANQILNGTHSYSEKELFNALYSPNPVKAYNEMMDAKVEKALKKSDDLIDNIEKSLGGK